MSVSTKVKQILWKRDKGSCFYCGTSLSWDDKTIDHVIPKSKGGPHRTWNLVLSCVDCNRDKGDSDPSASQLELALQRKILHDSRISIGKAIELCKKQNNSSGADKLTGLQNEISKMILLSSLPTDFVSILKTNFIE